MKRMKIVIASLLTGCLLTAGTQALYPVALTASAESIEEMTAVSETLAPYKLLELTQPKYAESKDTLVCVFSVIGKSGMDVQAWLCCDAYAISEELGVEAMSEKKLSKEAAKAENSDFAVAVGFVQDKGAEMFSAANLPDGDYYIKLQIFVDGGLQFEEKSDVLTLNRAASADGDMIVDAWTGYVFALDAMTEPYQPGGIPVTGTFFHADGVTVESIGYTLYAADGTVKTTGEIKKKDIKWAARKVNRELLSNFDSFASESCFGILLKLKKLDNGDYTLAVKVNYTVKDSPDSTEEVQIPVTINNTKGITKVTDIGAFMAEHPY